MGDPSGSLTSFHLFTSKYILYMKTEYIHLERPDRPGLTKCVLIEGIEEPIVRSIIDANAAKHDIQIDVVIMNRAIAIAVVSSLNPTKVLDVIDEIREEIARYEEYEDHQLSAYEIQMTEERT